MIKQKIRSFVKNVFETLGNIGKDVKDNVAGTGEYETPNYKQQEKILPEKQKTQIQGSEAARLAQVRKNLMEINSQLKQNRQEQAKQAIQETRVKDQEKKQYVQAKKQKDKDWAIKQQIKSAQGSKEAAQRASG